MAAEAPLKYESLLIEPDSNARNRLRQAIASMVQFGKATQQSTIYDGTKYLETCGRCDVVFLSHAFERDEVTKFITSAKATLAGRDAAYILILKSSDQKGGDVAKNIMAGGDGMLFEPYSVDQLLEITRLASKVKRERSQAREEAALKILISEIGNQIDIVSQMKSSGSEAALSMKLLRETAKGVEGLSAESSAIYYRLICDLFETRPVPTFTSKKYGGASSRVKKRLEEKLISEVSKAS